MTYSDEQIEGVLHELHMRKQETHDETTDKRRLGKAEGLGIAISILEGLE